MELGGCIKMHTNHKFQLWALSIVLLATALSASENEKYFSAQDLERECRNKSETCFGVIYGIQGTLLTESSIERLKGVVCLPGISADDIRIQYLSYAIDHRKEIKGMLGVSALFTMLYEKYPCPEEAKLRKLDGEKAVNSLEKQLENTH